MKDKVKPFLKEGEFVSSNDVIVAFLWLLRRELSADKHPITSAADLDLKDTYIVFTRGIEPATDPDIVPDHFYGNRFIYVPIINTGDGLKDASLPEAMAKLALMNRQTVSGLKAQPAGLVQGQLVFYQTVSTGKVTGFPPLERRMGMSTNVLKMPFTDIDFGSGRPVYLHVLVFPAIYDISPLAPGPKFEGVVLQMIMLDRHLEKFRASAVLKELAPGVKDFFGCSVEELKEQLDLKDL